MQYNKLVRDRIPKIIQEQGQTPITVIASEQEYHTKLNEKLQEEVTEFLQSGHHEELADILEVLYALGVAKGLSSEQLEQIRAKKAAERGGFSQRIILKEVKEQ